MKVEARLFLAIGVFFFPVAIVYAVFSHAESVGSAGIALLGVLCLMIGGYFMLLSRRIDSRPEDDAFGEIEDGAGDQGVFSPWSWWPLAIAAAAACVFAGLAVGWWLFFIGAAFGALALVGWVFEYSRGQHAH
jgi:hypothetical protein